MRMSSSWLKVSIGGLWKLFGNIVSLGAIVGAGYGIYLLVNYYIPPKSELLFKKIIANQIDVQTKDETVNLEKMAESSGTNILSPNELRLAQKNRIDADKKRKNLEAMLEKPEEKPISAKPKVITKSVWVARLLADGEQIKDAALVGFDQKANDKIEVDAKSPFSITATEIKFSYTKRGKLHEAILTREDPQSEHYYGIIDLSDDTKLELRLKEDGLEKYKGKARQMVKRGREIIYAPFITASLSKEEVVVP